MNKITVSVYRLVKNELAMLLMREPESKEIRAALKNIYDNTDENIRLGDIMSCLYDFRSDNYFLCEPCGQYHPNEDKYTINSDFDDGYYFCSGCIDEARGAAMDK